MEAPSSSFGSLGSYLGALSDTPARLRRRAFSVSTSYEETSRLRARSGPEMKRTLRWYDLVCFGVGGMVGAGVFVTTGRASRMYAGPAVVLSYAIAGVCALLSAFCYTEFAVDMPVAGGAFSYIRVTFGEFSAFMTASNLIVDYVLSNAAVARGFTAYLGTALGVPVDGNLRFAVRGLPRGYNEIDPIAVAVILILTLLICYSIRESSWVNMTLTALHISFVAFVIAMGFWKGELKNFVEPGNPNHAGGFFPFGISGVFNGAAMVYLSYIGYDAVSTMAEEVRNPVKDIPIGVSGSVILVAVLYCLMAASMSALLPYDMIDAEAPFSGAFQEGSSSWRWVSNTIGIGASFGILTSLLVSMVGQSRYMCVIGRSCVVPPWFARVHTSTSTPVNASLFLGICTAAIALFTDLEILLNLVSIGTLFVFYMVANAVVFRRYVAVGTTNPLPTVSFLVSFSLASIAFAAAWQAAPAGRMKLWMLSTAVAMAVAAVVVFRSRVAVARKPEFWGVPMMPWIPCASVFLDIFLLGSMDRPSYVRFGVMCAAAAAVYLLYGVHSSFDAEENGFL
ncbi:cationic amino acid transporter, partial [Genlisea aurea]